MVQNGANVNDVDGFGWGVLQYLCDIEQHTTAQAVIEKIDYFISIGVDVNYNINPTTNKKVMTALYLATMNKEFSLTLVPHLIQHHNADITITDDENRISLHEISEPELIPLLASPSTINHQGNDGSTPLIILLANSNTFNSDDNKYFQLVSKLIEYGADVNIPCNTGDYPIHAIFKFHFQHQPIDVIELIIKQHTINNNSDLNIVGYNKLTPLQLTIRRFLQPVDVTLTFTASMVDEIRLKAIQSIKLLLQYNANVTTQLFHGRTILHFISMNAYRRRSVVDINQINDDLVEDYMVTIIDGIIDQTITNIKE